MSNWAARILNGCVGVVQRALPATCLLCGEQSGRSALCAACEAGLPRLGLQACAICAIPIATGSVCGACLDSPPSYDRTTATYTYDFPLDELVQAYKYGGALALAPLFARALAHSVPRDIDLLVPMPLGPARLRERGFNQAYEIARRVGAMIDIPVAARACRKPADTPPQAALPWKARAKNVRGAFVCDVDLKGRRVAIIDDVMTTGATLNELSKKLKMCGAVEVSACVVARALPREAR